MSGDLIERMRGMEARAIKLNDAFENENWYDLDEHIVAFITLAKLLREASAALEARCVPGVWRCAKCEFRLVQSTLNARDGTVSPRDQPGEPCPNCASPLWRVSWEQEAHEGYRIAEQQMDRAIRAEARIAGLIDSLQRLGSSEAFVVSRAIDPVRDEELLARLEFARSAASRGS